MSFIRTQKDKVSQLLGKVSKRKMSTFSKIENISASKVRMGKISFEAVPMKKMGILVT